MTLQQMYNFITTQLAIQGAPSTKINKGGFATSCMYRGDHGRKCAVGHLIPDSMYSRDMDAGMSVSTLIENFPQLHMYLLADDVTVDVSKDFLGAMQSVHDQCPVSIWPDQFAKVGQRFGLQTEQDASFAI